MSAAPEWNSDFRAQFEQLLVWRRDVRHFRRDPIAPEIISDLIKLACLAPSVGNSQPWRFVLVENAERRAAIRANFLRCNQAALEDFEGEQAKLYASLKLSGLDDAPVHIALFCDRATTLGHGLGRKTMAETLDYSVVAAIHNFWLAARLKDIGVGWVSIIDPEQVKTTLEVPPDWRLIAYLCIGHPKENHDTPELARLGWQERADFSTMILKR